MFYQKWNKLLTFHHRKMEADLKQAHKEQHR